MWLNLILERKTQCGRPREYISGHNPQVSPTIDLVLDTLSAGQKTVKEIVDLHPSKSETAIKVCLSRLKRRGLITNKKGIWKRNE